MKFYAEIPERSSKEHDQAVKAKQALRRLARGSSEARKDFRAIYGHDPEEETLDEHTAPRSVRLPPPVRQPS